MASDANGDYVCVWSVSTAQSAASNGAEQPGVYAQLYQAAWTGEPTNRQVSYSAGTVVQVTSDAYGQDAAVASDAAGDFVVTWDEDDPTRDNGYDIWAQRFSKGLQPLGDSPANSAPFVVNSTLTGNQRYPAVAMDTEGDFVITWQSNGNTTAGSNQGNTGYGVYYQRFTPGGALIGGVNDVQTLTFSGNFVASDNFTLNWNGQTTASISYDGSPLDAASAIQNALDNIGANVQVQALSSTEVTIEFVGLEGSQFEPQIQVGTTNFSEGGSVVAATLVSGVSGESPVSQRRPATRPTRPSPWLPRAISSSPGRRPGRAATLPTRRASTPRRSPPIRRSMAPSSAKSIRRRRRLPVSSP